MKLIFVTLILLSVLLSSSFLPTQASIIDIDSCDLKCKGRCAKAGYMERCLKYCGICCQQCKCVPSGTYGYANKDDCPCYRKIKNSSGRSKCP